MTSAELTNWGAFEQEFGPLMVQDRVDFGFARLMHLLAQVYRAPRARAPRFRDFLPPWFARQLQGQMQSPDQLKAAFESMVSHEGGR